MRTATVRGFTIIELMVVVAIIGILVGLLSSGVSRSMAKARRTQEAAQIGALKSAFWAYRQEYGRWPCPYPEGGQSTVVYQFTKPIFTMMSPVNRVDNPHQIHFLNFNDLSWDPYGNACSPVTGGLYWVSFDYGARDDVLIEVAH